jgi:glycosyltransferase involved in cell wall biosynthesis
MSKKIRLAFYTENLLVGGAERYLLDLINGLDTERFDIALFHNPNPVFEEFIKANVKAPITREQVSIMCIAYSTVGQEVQARVRGKWRPIWELMAVPRALLRYLEFGVNFFRLQRVFRRAAIDILHINNGGYPGGESCRAAVLAAASIGVPICIMSVHNIAYEVGPMNLIERLIDGMLNLRLNKLITESQASGVSLVERRHFAAEKIRNIYLGIKPKPLPPGFDVVAKRGELHIPPGAKVVGMVALFEPRKGYHVLLEAAVSIVQKVPEACFVLVGDGPIRQDMEKLAKKLGIANRTLFLGSRRDFREIMATFDVFVLPSLEFESLPYVVLEAMDAAKPIVGTSVGGIPEEIVNGLTGLVVPPGNAQALSQAIVDLLQNPTKAKAMGEAGQKRLETVFRMDNFIQETTKLYEELIQSCHRLAQIHDKG